MGSESNLSDRVKTALDMLLDEYLEDAERIARRAAKLKKTYLIPKITGTGDDLPDLDDLFEEYLKPESDPPNLPRIALLSDMTYIWGQKEIAVVLARSTSAVARNLKALETPEWAERLRAVRRPMNHGMKCAQFLYSDGIFNLILDYYTHQYILTRIIEPRSGENLTPAQAQEVWAYWDGLRKDKGDWPAISDGENDGGGKYVVTPVALPDFEDESGFPPPYRETASVTFAGRKISAPYSRTASAQCLTIKLFR